MRKDILLHDDDLRIENGDFVIDESDTQHVQHIINAEKGHYKQFPLLGVGVRRYLNAPLNGSLRREIQLQLQADGYDADKIVTEGANIYINA